MSLIKLTQKGLFCEKGNFYIDPWRPVEKALITHAHSDHARYGHKKYLVHNSSINILKLRLGSKISVQGIAFNSPLRLNGVEVTYFPAGHIVGSSQIRIRDKNECWVISGDYNTTSQELVEEFVPVKCDVFVTESTFGIPVFQWQKTAEVIEQIHSWWSQNQQNNRPSIISAYSLGKAQRIIQELDHTIGPVLTHPSVEAHNEAIRKSGIGLKATQMLNDTKEDINKSLIVCPPGAAQSKWTENIKNHALAFASGWMALRGAKRRRNIEKGFVLSDHADWEGLNYAIAETEAERVYVTHGYSDIFCKWLKEKGIEAYKLETAFEGETIESEKAS